jgi:oligopeptide transport system permease protein
MDNSNRMFEYIGKDLKAAQKINRPNMSYLQDSIRRLKKNVPAIISFWILVVMIIMSLIGPIISKKLYGHTYSNQNLEDQYQTSIMSNCRSIVLKKNDVFEYEDFNNNFRKTKLIFYNIGLKSDGIIEFKIGNKDDEPFQGDKKEYSLKINVNDNDNLNSIVNKLNEEGHRILSKDSNFRGVTFNKKGNDLIIKTKGDKWFNNIYWFGTDEFGRDIFTRVWEGGRISFLIAFISVFVTIIFGIAYGGVSGYFGGKADEIMMRIIEILMVIPGTIYTILLLTIMKPGLKPIIIVMAATSWMDMARIIRGEVLKLKYSEYVTAAKKLGANSRRVIIRHIIPNTMGIIIVHMTMLIPKMIFAEAFLSFIGLGVPAPFASWGSLINEGAKVFLQYPHLLLVPSIVLSLTMLAFNVLGDGLRDALDPRLRM